MSLRAPTAARARLKTCLLAGAALLAVAVSAGSCGFADNSLLEVRRYTFESPDLPAAFDGTRIALVTDIHHGPFYTREEVADLVARVNRLEPDLVLLGGDYVFTSTEYETPCFAELASLRAPLGRFAVLGAHDYGAPDSDDPGPGSAIRAAAQAGITLLRNQAVWLERDGQRVRLGGAADYQVDTPELEPIAEGTVSGDFVLLLSHNPDYAEDLPADAVDLVLSGHTHGGQVTILGSWAPYVPSKYGQKYRSGIVQNDVTTVIVSNGVGTSTRIPLRLFTPSQIVVLTLLSAPSASLHPWSHDV